MVFEANECLHNDKDENKSCPNNGVKLSGMDGIVHVVPAAEFLFGAVYSESGAVNSRESDQNICVSESVCMAIVIDDRRQENDRPEIRHTPPELEVADAIRYV